MKKTVLAIALLAAGCVATTPTAVRPFQPSSGEVATAEAAVANLLRDPGSIQTRNLRGYRAASGDVIICGEYNSRNGFGGYGGFSAFYVRLLAGGGQKAVADENGGLVLAGYACSQAAAGSIDLPAA